MATRGFNALLILTALFGATAGCAIGQRQSLGHTPDEMYFGMAPNLPTELAAARKLARAARLAANRGLSCERCRSEQVITPEPNIPP